MSSISGDSYQTVCFKGQIQNGCGCDSSESNSSHLDGAIVQGNNVNLKFIVTDQNGTKINLIDVLNITWTLKTDITSSTNVLQRILGTNLNLTDPEDGEFTVILNAADTISLSGYFVHEAVLTMDDGSVCTVTSGGTDLAYGQFVIRQRISVPQ